MQIGTVEAKTHFSQIIEDVQNGRDYIITKRGKPVAKIIPIKEAPAMTFQEAVDNLMRMRKLFRGKPDSFNVRKAIEDGRGPNGLCF